MQGRKWHILHLHKLVEAYDGHTSLYAGGALCLIAQEILKATATEPTSFANAVRVLHRKVQRFVSKSHYLIYGYYKCVDRAKESRS